MRDQVESRLGQQRAVGHHGTGVGSQLEQRGLELGIPGVLGFEDGYAELLGPQAHGTGEQLAAAPTRGIGASDDADEVVAAGRDRIEGGDGHLRGAGKDEAHQNPNPFVA